MEREGRVGLNIRLQLALSVAFSSCQRSIGGAWRRWMCLSRSPSRALRARNRPRTQPSPNIIARNFKIPIRYSIRWRNQRKWQFFVRRRLKYRVGCLAVLFELPPLRSSPRRRRNDPAEEVSKCLMKKPWQSCSLRNLTTLIGSTRTTSRRWNVWEEHWPCIYYYIVTLVHF
jgi:hypothetical protein